MVNVYEDIDDQANELRMVNTACSILGEGAAEPFIASDAWGGDRHPLVRGRHRRTRSQSDASPRQFRPKGISLRMNWRDFWLIDGCSFLHVHADMSGKNLIALGYEMSFRMVPSALSRSTRLRFG